MPRSRHRRVKPATRTTGAETTEAGDAVVTSPDPRDDKVLPSAFEKPDTPDKSIKISKEKDVANSEEHSDLPEEDDDGLSNDVIFQCSSCRSVVGDTLSEYEAHLESKTISLKAARSVVIEGKMKMSSTGFDAGCTYRPIRCSECQHHLGRVYGSTTPALDSRRCTYTFDTTTLVSYQLGTCLTIDGGRMEPGNRHGTGNGRDSQSGEAGKMSVTTEAYDALHAHVGSLTELVNKLSASFDDNCLEVKTLTDANNNTIADLKTGIENAQNMMLLWEERFRRLAACEQRLEQLSVTGHRMSNYEGRMARVENALGGYASPSKQHIHRTPSRLKISPSIRKPTASPARMAMRTTVSPARPAMRAAPSPARGPMRRADSSPAVTANVHLPKRRR
ncbi:unnamed protein product [Chondrus crispus]|uniref:Mis18 domain-containing protein n=1 Tax=Chondrus crispus TaxID=2769 RepID=R7QDN6_CHOCR|nr:unnamed protein product [Chondrus crispus]CDF35551.1 unnamed protein product [Chondrus crispus]|eukprot:XP_005715370.1 unnamed protein product [Chondrus crispus]